ncbi:DUF3021 domain-containing protein [Isobaculum melis]|uniref:DUF3021 domain-containing protein n=1 Tax=Isobaculum melis TaxID=142588 RepID=A0A1H9TWY7_9LACT|nr:DUF3021 domain-containing protein [Isobaculum melis]SES01283.1 Protein of unknown function [Isobaculum melis]
MKNLLKNSGIGLGIGCTIYTISGAIFTTGMIQKSILLVIIMGLLIGAFSTIHENQTLSLLTKCTIQFFSSYASFLVAAFLGAWFPFKLPIIFTASLLFVVIFFVIWSLFYLIEKRELAVINEKLSK